MISTQIESLKKLQIGQFRRNTFHEVVVQVQGFKAIEIADAHVDVDEAILGQVDTDDVTQIQIGGQLGWVSLDLLRREDQLTGLLTCESGMYQA